MRLNIYVKMKVKKVNFKKFYKFDVFFISLKMNFNRIYMKKDNVFM